ncbi:MAG: molecular chaperone TorD family protein [Acidobacteriota bacterium]
MKTETVENRLIVEASEWRLISLLFDCPTGKWFDDVKALGDQVTDTRLKRAALSAQKEASEGLFHSIFGPGGPAPGREVSYRGWVQPGYMLSELSSFYAAFSYKPVTNEVPDHVAIETGFIAYLRLKEAFAVDRFDTESAEITAEAAKNFINEHLSKYAEQMSKILNSSGIEYLSLAGAALFKRVGRDKDKENQRFLPVLESDEENTEFECGLA